MGTGAAAPCLARVGPGWLYPITGWTIGILALVLLFIAQLVDAMVTHWREDRRDKKK